MFIVSGTEKRPAKTYLSDTSFHWAAQVGSEVCWRQHVIASPSTKRRGGGIPATACWVGRAWIQKYETSSNACVGTTIVHRTAQRRQVKLMICLNVVLLPRALFSVIRGFVQIHALHARKTVLGTVLTWRVHVVYLAEHLVFAYPVIGELLGSCRILDGTCDTQKDAEKCGPYTVSIGHWCKQRFLFCGVESGHRGCDGVDAKLPLPSTVDLWMPKTSTSQEAEKFPHGVERVGVTGEVHHF